MLQFGSSNAQINEKAYLTKGTGKGGTSHEGERD